MSSKEITSLAAYLRDKREAAGLSQRQLAALAHVDHSYLAKLESGKISTRPNPEHLQRLCDALGVDLAEAMSLLGIRSTLPEPRVYFRRALGVSADDAEILAQLVADYQVKQKKGGKHEQAN
jgi:transcriptional regulator with XRE-family HTH domain